MIRADIILVILFVLYFAHVCEMKELKSECAEVRGISPPPLDKSEFGLGSEWLADFLASDA